MRFSIRVDRRKIRSLQASLARTPGRLQEDVSHVFIDATVRAEAAARAGASRLPRRGGLAARVAGSRFERRRRRFGFGQSVELVVTGNYDLRGIDQGEIVHPTFGHRPWVSQRVPGGWFSEPTEPVLEGVNERVNLLVARTISLIR